MRLLYYVLFFYTHIVYTIEYIYPVASLNNGATILYIHQHTPTHIELLQWDTITNQYTPLLWSLFNPAGLQLLPHQLGFSFIDSGRLRIKLFQKRSPKTIDFDEPIYNINGLQWIDEHSCYCSAQKGDNFSLFELHDNGDVRCLISEQYKDYMYPQKIDNDLFYIERSVHKNKIIYQIIQSFYPHESPHIIINFYERPIIFLHMISEKEGFVLEHAENIDSADTITRFSYHHLTCKNDLWNNTILFSFSIPVNLVLPGNERIYESLLPLLPRIEQNNIYFVDCSSDYHLKPYVYNLTTYTIEKVKVPQKKGHYFVPILCANKLYCGGTKEENSNSSTLISLLT